MTKKEFVAWQAITESSRNKWTECEIFRLNDHGRLYYIGGKDGQYIEIDNNGRLKIGTYEGAIPHIGEATFKKIYSKQCKNLNDAFETAIVKVGGKKFLADMFSVDTKDEIVLRAWAQMDATTQRNIAKSKNSKGQDRYSSEHKTILKSKATPKLPSKSSDKAKTMGGDVL